MAFTVISELLLYLCIALLTGSLLLLAIPNNRRPDINISKKLLLASCAGFLVFSFVPLLNIVFLFSGDLGLWPSFYAVLFTFTVGKAWLFTTGVGLILFLIIYFNNLSRDMFLSRIALLPVLLMIIGYTQAGHAATISPILGFWSHFIHLLAVAVWGGIVITVGWFSKRGDKWLPFLNWFHRIALGAFLLVILAGISTMLVDIKKPLESVMIGSIDQYQKGLVLNYGQALLIKQTLVIPLTVYAAFNGFIIKKRLEAGHHLQPHRWIKAESLILVMIFAVTAYMGQQAPPHDLTNMLKTGEPSPLFQWIFPSPITPGIQLKWVLTGLNSAFLLTGVTLIGTMFIILLRRPNKIMTFCLGMAAALSFYLAVMLGIKPL